MIQLTILPQLIDRLRVLTDLATNQATAFSSLGVWFGETTRKRINNEATGGLPVLMYIPAHTMILSAGFRWFRVLCCILQYCKLISGDLDPLSIHTGPICRK